MTATKPKPTLQGLPQEVLENIAVFCGNVGTISPSEDVDTFTDTVIHPIMNAAASDQWQSGYNDLRALSLTSKTFTHAAQRALFKVAQVNSTGALMRFIRALLLNPEKRRLVRCFIAQIDDHMRPLPCRLMKPQPLVLGEFLHYVCPILSTIDIAHLPADSFFCLTLPLPHPSSA